MEWTIRLEVKTGWGKVETVELASFTLPVLATTADNVGLSLAAAKSLLARLQEAMVRGQVAEYLQCRKVCPDCLPFQPLASQAAAERALPFGLLRLVGLLPLRRRHAGIVRCLRWLAEFGFEFLNSPFRHIKTLPQRSDQRILLGVAQKAEIGWRGHPAFRIASTVP
jgi:hypothetical protein